MNCLEAPSYLTLPACQEMVCRFQVCLQRYLADPVIRGANVSYKKPCMNVAQVCRSTLHSARSTLFTMLGSRRWCLHLPPAVMFRVCRPSLVRVKQLMGSHFGGNKLMAWIALRYLLTWPCQRATRWCVGFKFVCRGTLQTRSFEVKCLLQEARNACSTGLQKYIAEEEPDIWWYPSVCSASGEMCGQL